MKLIVFVALLLIHQVSLYSVGYVPGAVREEWKHPRHSLESNHGIKESRNRKFLGRKQADHGNSHVLVKDNSQKEGKSKAAFEEYKKQKQNYSNYLNYILHVPPSRQSVTLTLLFDKPASYQNDSLQGSSSSEGRHHHREISSSESDSQEWMEYISQEVLPLIPAPNPSFPNELPPIYETVFEFPIPVSVVPETMPQEQSTYFPLTSSTSPPISESEVTIPIVFYNSSQNDYQPINLSPPDNLLDVPNNMRPPTLVVIEEITEPWDSDILLSSTFSQPVTTTEIPNPFHTLSVLSVSSVHNILNTTFTIIENSSIPESVNTQDITLTSPSIDYVTEIFEIPSESPFPTSTEDLDSVMYNGSMLETDDTVLPPETVTIIDIDSPHDVTQHTVPYDEHPTSSLPAVTSQTLTDSTPQSDTSSTFEIEDAFSSSVVASTISLATEIVETESSGTPMFPEEEIADTSSAISLITENTEHASSTASMTTEIVETESSETALFPEEEIEDTSSATPLITENTEHASPTASMTTESSETALFPEEEIADTSSATSLITENTEHASMATEVVETESSETALFPEEEIEEITSSATPLMTENTEPASMATEVVETENSETILFPEEEIEEITSSATPLITENTEPASMATEVVETESSEAILFPEEEIEEITTSPAPLSTEDTEHASMATEVVETESSETILFPEEEIEDIASPAPLSTENTEHASHGVFLSVPEETSSETLSIDTESVDISQATETTLSDTSPQTISDLPEGVPSFPDSVSNTDRECSSPASTDLYLLESSKEQQPDCITELSTNISPTEGNEYSETTLYPNLNESSQNIPSVVEKPVDVLRSIRPNGDLKIVKHSVSDKERTAEIVPFSINFDYQKYKKRSRNATFSSKCSRFIIKFN